MFNAYVMSFTTTTNKFTKTIIMQLKFIPAMNLKHSFFVEFIKDYSKARAKKNLGNTTRRPCEKLLRHTIRRACEYHLHLRNLSIYPNKNYRIFHCI